MAWKTKDIDDFCYVTDFVANGSFASLKENAEYLDSPGYAILVRYTDYSKNWKKNFKYVSKDSYNFLKKSSLNPGDLIMANVGYPGKSFLLPNLGMPTTLGPNSILIRPEDRYSTPRFLHYYFLSEIGQQSIENISTGAAQKKFNKTSFRKLKITLPTLSEQKKIVKILDETFESISKSKEATEKNLENAKELFESYLDRVFSNPGGDWEKKKLREVCKKTSNIKWGNTAGEDFRYIDLSAVSRTELEITSSVRVNKKNAPSRAKKIIKTKDVIFATTRPTLKRISRVPSEYNDQICSTGFTVLRPDKENVISELVFYFLQTSIFMKNMEELQRGASYPAVSDNDVKNQSFNYPKSISWQKQIVSKLGTLSKEIKELETIYEQKVLNLDELKKSILKKAFVGELIKE